MRRLPEWVLDHSLEVLVLCLIMTLDSELHPDIGEVIIQHSVVKILYLSFASFGGKFRYLNMGRLRMMTP